MKKTDKQSLVGIEYGYRAKKKARNSLTKEDVAMILELRSEGVKMSYISRYVYNIAPTSLYQHLKRWGAV